MSRRSLLLACLCTLIAIVLQGATPFRPMASNALVVSRVSSVSPAQRDQAAVAPAEAGVYAEDFTTYAARDDSIDSDWDVWNRELRLSPAGSWIYHEYSSVAPLPDGSVAIAWMGPDGVLLQRVDARGNRLWQTDVLANGPAARSTRWPAVAVDASENILVTWVDGRSPDTTSYSDIYMHKLDMNGHKLWPEELRVNSETQYFDHNYPAISVDSLGNAVAVWQDYRNGDSDADIYAQRISPNGNKLWAVDVKVNTDKGKASQQYGPAVSVDSTGNSVIAWTDTRSGDADIYAQYLTPNGGKAWTADLRVNSDQGAASQGTPDLITAPDSAAFIVWQDYRDTTTAIYAQRISAAGAKEWSQDAHITTQPHITQPRLVPGNSDNAFIAWEAEDHIYAQKLDLSGQPLWTSYVRVSAGGAEQGLRWWPDIAVTPLGAFLTWTRVIGDNRLIEAQALSSDGRLLITSDVAISTNTGAATQDQAALAVDAAGNLVAAWRDRRHKGSNIFAQRFDPAGQRLWTVDLMLSEGRDPQYLPTIRLGQNGMIVASWLDDRDWGGPFNMDIYSQQLDAEGNRLWPTDRRVNARPQSVDWSPTFAVADDGSAVVVWRSWRGGLPGIWAQRIDTNGNPSWPDDVRVNSVDLTTSPTDQSVLPAIAVDPSGRAVVVWNDDRSIDSDVYAQALAPDGSKLWIGDIRVNSGDRNTFQGSAGVAVDANGNATVAWTDHRNGNADIYAQRLDRDGNQLWSADHRVDSDTGTATAAYPVVAGDSSGNTVVAWHGSEGTERGIFAQRLDPAGNRLWPQDVRANAYMGSGWRLYPQAAMNEAGAIGVAWSDGRNSDDDVYVQRLDSAGNRLWPADLPLVNPDRFYAPTGTTRSRTVDTIAASIGQATLTTDYETNGGEVQFYLTNNGGTDWFPVTPGVTHVFTTTGSDLRWKAVLSADPLWPRTPVVNTLRIEYSSQTPYADDYEADDTCAAARPLQVNGAAQDHTFHQQADADWAWFDVFPGVTYVIQTAHTQDRADTILELRRDCPLSPLAFDDNAFGAEARITWQATFTGRIYIKVANHDLAAYGENTGYDLSVRTAARPPVAVIVGGHNDSYELRSNINYAGDMAYRTLLSSGLPKSNIRYFSPDPNRDVDNNGLLDDIAGLPAPANVRDAIQDWSRTRGVALGVPFYLYLMDHGHYDQFLADGTAGKITAPDLNLWLSNLEATSGADNVNVIIEACHSGSFIDVSPPGPATISGRNRVVIASTSSLLNAYPSPQGAYFSDAFWTALGQNKDLFTAFTSAVQAVQATDLSQYPWLDDNGDAAADSRDGALARARGLAAAFAGSPPAVDWVQVGPVKDGQATIQAQVRDDFGVASVRAVIYPPDFVEPPPSEDGITPPLNLPSIALAPAGTNLYSVSYNAFSQNGHYRVVLYAHDADDNQAQPVSTVVTVSINTTATPTTTSTSTPITASTPTGTSTATSTPTATATSTGTPVVGRQIYLPLVFDGR